MGVDEKAGLFGMEYVQLGGFLLNHVFRYVMMASNLQLSFVNTKLNVFGYSALERDDRIKRAQLVEMIFLPVVFVSYAISLALFYPVFLLPAIIRACYRRLFVGKVSDFLHTDMMCVHQLTQSDFLQPLGRNARRC